VTANSKGEQMPRLAERVVTIRFPQVDPAGIVFYPRYFEMIFRHFADVPFAGTPTAIKTQFLKPNRLGDQISIAVDTASQSGGWSVTGRMNGNDCFSMRPLETNSELPADAHRQNAAAFKTEPEGVGEWCSDRTGCMQLSRYFELLNQAIEVWFEATLDVPFHELHVERKVGIPTVQFNTRVRRLPAVGESVSIWLRPVKIGDRSMTFRSWLVSNDECLVENEQVVVFVQMLDGGFESIRIPDYIRDSFEAQLQETGSRD